MLYCPSMMCSKFEKLQEEVIALDNAGADIFHIDIMDGHFVPNFGMGIQDVEVIRQNTKKLIDVHLMINNPDQYIDLFADLGVDIIYVHPESDVQITRTLEKIRMRGKKVGIALNPGTSISQVEELFPLIDYLMVMTVNPGFSGQKYLDFVNKKIQKLTLLKKEYDFKVLIDGSVSLTAIDQLTKMDVDGFVLGTSTLFGKDRSYQEIFQSLKREVY